MSYTIKDMTEHVYGFLPDPTMTSLALTVGSLIPQLTDNVNAYLRRYEQVIDCASDTTILIMLLRLLDDTDDGMRLVRSTLLFGEPAELTATSMLDGTPCQTPLHGWGRVFDGHAQYGAITVTLHGVHHYEMTADDIEAAASMYDDDEDQRWW